MPVHERIPASALVVYVAAVFERVGLPPAGAARLAEALVEADLRGLPSHGVLHAPNLVRRIRSGLVDPRAELRILNNGPSTALVDAGHGPGHLMAARAMDLAIAKARETGVGAVGVTDSTHFGMGALYAEQAAAAGMFGVAFSNSTPLLAAPGGAQRLVGTNPIAVAVPGQGGKAALSLDMGLGQITVGRVRDYLNRGELLPEGVAADRHGVPSRDPAAVLDGGFLLPNGGHKGLGLALVVEVLTGVLTGAGITSEVGSLFADYDRPQRTGHFFIAIDIARYMEPTRFARRMESLAAWVRSSPVAPGEPPLRLPGVRAAEEAGRQREQGVTISPATRTALLAMGQEFGVTAPSGLVPVPVKE
ncbi:MAG TPA: Ldh family oxidoreductase [Symbiobacteriaceae bacterium]|nr:Ldh family oxidoreductase [Symbiobacteriaceae bacterium]